MAALNGNNAYLSINGYVVGAVSGADSNIYRSCEFTLNTGDEDVTAGSGVEWEEHASKLSRINMTATIVYDAGSVTDDLTGVLNDLGRGSVVRIIYGPEGNGTGKPKHEQDFLITQITGPAVGYDKPAVTFQLTGASSGAPVSNIYDGDTWA